MRHQRHFDSPSSNQQTETFHCHGDFLLSLSIFLLPFTINFIANQSDEKYLPAPVTRASAHLLLCP